MQQDISKQNTESGIELNFNFIETLRILLGSKRLIIFVTIAFSVIGWIYSHFFNPALPPNYESASIIEIGSYPAPDHKLSDSRDGRLLIASMEAASTKLNAVFGMHRSLESGGFTYVNEYDELIHRIRIIELDSQFMKIEVVGATIETVKNKTNEIIEFLKTMHKERLDEFISKKKNDLQEIEEKLLTIDKFINYISEQNDIYVSDVADLKLKQIEYNYQLLELKNYLTNMKSLKNTDLVGETQYKTNYPPSNIIKLTLASFIAGLIFSSLFVLIRHALNKSDEE